MMLGFMAKKCLRESGAAADPAERWSLAAGVGQKVLPQRVVQRWVCAMGRCSEKGLPGVKKGLEIH